jgi:hypothetical protein
LVQAILDGERAQLPDIVYGVSGEQCPSESIYVERHNSGPTVRVWEPPANPDRRWERAYRETGYANRAAFAEALPSVLTPFYACKEFAFTFGRYQGWPTSDSFRVTVDAKGTITGVSPLVKNEMD